MQRLKLRIEESGEKLSAAYAPPKWSETAEEEEDDIKHYDFFSTKKWLKTLKKL